MHLGKPTGSWCMRVRRGLRGMLNDETAANVPISLILSYLMMEVILSSKMAVLTRVTWCHIPDDGILPS
jgi:hypothetical protein